MPAESDRQKSFELYRNSMKSVAIITYDEMLAKLRALLDFLRATSETPALANETVGNEEPEDEGAATEDGEVEDLEP